MNHKLMTVFEKVETFLKGFGLSFGALIVGLLGAWSSLEFFPDISWKRKVVLWLTGGLTASFGGQILAYYLQIDHLVYAATFFVGLMGMKVINFILDLGKAIIKNPKEAFDIISIFTKFKK